MSEDKSVSVVVATRDRPELLKRALGSIDAQTHKYPIEVVLVFDQSEPDLSLESQYENIDVKVISNTRVAGLAGARNSGFAAASNSWVALCDDDDEWLPEKLEQQFDALEGLAGSKAAWTGIYIHFEGKDTPRVPVQESLSFRGFLTDRMTEVHPSSWLVDKELLINEVGLVDEEIPGSYGEDYDFFLRTAKVTKIAVAPQPLVRVWWHGSSFFFERWQMIDTALEYLLEKYPEFQDTNKGSARIKGQQALAKAAMGKRKEAFSKILETAKLNLLEKRIVVASIVAAGFPAEKALKFAHKFGKGI